jgi:hypothetical protein
MEGQAVSAYTTVEVYCDAESHKRWVIERFALMGPADWLPESQLPDTEPLRRRPDAFAHVDETTDTYLGKPFGPSVVTVRDSHNLRCTKCDDMVKARAENLNPILDVLAASGVSQISLTALRARL